MAGTDPGAAARMAEMRRRRRRAGAVQADRELAELLGVEVGARVRAEPHEPSRQSYADYGCQHCYPEQRYYAEVRRVWNDETRVDTRTGLRLADLAQADLAALARYDLNTRQRATTVGPPPAPGSPARGHHRRNT